MSIRPGQGQGPRSRTQSGRVSAARRPSWLSRWRFLPLLRDAAIRRVASLAQGVGWSQRLALAPAAAGVAMADPWSRPQVRLAASGADRPVGPEPTSGTTPPVQALLDACPMLALLVDADGRITHTNGRLDRLVGADRAGGAGRPCSAVLAAVGGRELADCCDRAPRAEPFCAWVQVRGGALWPGDSKPAVDVAVTGTPVEDDVGRRGLLLTLQPQADARAQAGTPSDLLLLLSHELRRPLSFISASAELLAEGGLAPEAQTELLRAIRSESNSLAGLLEAILDAERVRSGASAVEHKAVALEPLVRSVLDAMHTGHPGYRIEVHAPRDLPPARGDRTRIAIVLRNLLENAVKYSAVDSAVQVSIERPDADELQVNVTDQGCGIAPEHLGHLFQRFWRASPAGDNGWGGHGVGLYVCRVLVEAQGGRIGVRSTPGRGSTFWFTVPVLDGEQ